MQPHTTPLTADLEHLARKRAGAKLGWYLHACVYVLVNLFLAYLSSRHSTHWAIFPALGWGFMEKTMSAVIKTFRHRPLPIFPWPPGVAKIRIAGPKCPA